MRALLIPAGTTVLTAVALAGSALVAPGAAVGSGLSTAVHAKASAMPHAPDGSGGKTVWTEADKAGFGTARA